ncbi:hypothetical protein [Nocardia neocaledoniensis]|uniref:hypothetical protein n=1 Tax=Nocardia neocaledoniensis TaxID=236511 RepID=UPI0024554A96|nr:hypothetical protein [Nocardia neocaledoniensis]
MTENPYPNLGFNPTPGDATEVATLSTKVKTAADAVTETNALLTSIRNSNDEVWKGEAGDAFRAGFDATLAQDLGLAQSSLQQADTAIAAWYTALVAFQDTAKGLETEAATARSNHAQAVTALQQAKANPDLGLANKTFSDASALADAQSRLNAANAQVTSASTAVDNCQAAIDAIIARAKDLESAHNAKATATATELESAANFAPSEPDKSWWDRLTDWIDENRDAIHEVLSTTSAIGGILALVTPPPISAIALGISLAAGAGALALTATNDELRDDLVNGSWTERLGAAATVGGDLLSVVPGASGVFKAGKVALMGGGADDLGRFGMIAQTWGEAANDPGLVARVLTDRNAFGVTDQLASSGATTGVHSLLQLTGVEGKHFMQESPATALAVLQRMTGASYKTIDLSQGVGD